MPDWFFKFGLGGVQDFIGQSRKLRDLAAGSKIIANCAHEAFEYASVNGASLRLPAGVDDTASCPHQLVFRISDKNRDVVTAFGKELLDEVRRNWLKWAGKQFDDWHAAEKKRGIKGYATALIEEAKVGKLEESDLLSSHVDSALEAYWVAVEIGDDERVAFDRLLTQFDDRRHTRTFQQLKVLDKSKSWTCSLCGARPAILDVPSGGWPSKRVFVTKAEKLCVVCVARRRFALDDKKNRHVPSTHRLSLARFFTKRAFADVRKLANDDVWVQVFDHFAELEELDRQTKNEGQNSSRSGAKTATREDDSIEPLLPVFRDLKDSEGGFRRVQKIPPYYAVVAFDGDQMGRWFSGDQQLVCEQNINDAKKFTEFQCTLSTALSGFASAVTSWTSESKNDVTSLVYAGGDDALVLSSLDELFPMVAKVRDLWNDVPASIKEYCVGGKGPTLSLHTSIVHAKTPIQPVMREVRRRLEYAKEKADRNCLSFLVAPGSGAPSAMLTRWDELKPMIQLVEALSNWRRGSPEPASEGVLLPMQLPYKLLETLPSLRFPSSDRKELQGDDVPEQIDHRLFKLEMKLLHSRTSPDREVTDERWNSVSEWLCKRAKHDYGDSLHLHGYEAVAGALEVCAFLARCLNWTET